MIKTYYSDDQVKTLVSNILRDITADILKEGWKPDYVVGITRGGLQPAVMISHYMQVPCETLRISLRDTDGEDCETNCWMSEDAIGGMGCKNKKNILVIDDINDSGSTLKWLKKDWEASCRSKEWKNVWNKNVRFASLVNNKASKFKKIDYAGTTIDKSVKDEWIVFPWEQWW